MDYKANQKFFKGSGGAFWKLLIIASLVLTVVPPHIFGVIVLVAGIVYKAMGKKDYDVIRKQCEKMISKAKQDGMQRLGIDEGEVGLIAPMVIHGFEYTGRVSSKEISKATWVEVSLPDGKKILATPIYSICVIFFTEHVVQRYEHIFSLVSDDEIKNTDEYFYKDIVSVSTAAESGKYPVGKEEKSYKYDTLVISTAGGKAACSTINASGIQDSINGFRSLLKQKKMATA